MRNKTKLELTWIGKGKHPKLEPRILLEDPEKSYHAERRVTNEDVFDNMLIHGDNLLALKALEHDYTGKVKCIYIDPPFNVGAAVEHYDDGIEHSQWLNIMYERVIILRRLLAEDGSIFVHIDNEEQAYLKVILDEVFDRRNFVQMISVKRASPAGFKVINPGPITVTDYIFLYAKNKEKFCYYPQRVATSYDSNYNLIIDNPQESAELWSFSKIVDILYARYEFSGWRDARKAWGSNWKLVRNSLLGDIALKNADRVVSVRDPHKPSDRIVQAMSQSRENPGRVLVIEREQYDPIYIYNGGSLSFYSNKVHEVDGQLTPTKMLTDFWPDMNFAGIAREGGVKFKNSKKPEVLVKRILELSTKPNDLVLDSFLGSGTTAAVAHKMGRRWIGIELGDHCYTHCQPRLSRVVSGEDQSGISSTVDWKGGGGFRFYHLAPSLLEKDKWGNWVISKEYNAVMLAEAMCVHEGFTYSPNEEIYWQHGYSTETDFIYVTTQMLNYQQLVALSDEVGSERSLLVCCAAFRGNVDDFPNLTVKKIPKAVLHNCEWGHDDYSLEVSSLPAAPTPEEKAEKLIQELPLFAIEEKDE